MTAGLPWKRFHDCISCPISGDVNKAATRSLRDQETYSLGLRIGLNAVRHKGVSIVHSVKDAKTAQLLLAARHDYLKEHTT